MTFNSYNKYCDFNMTNVLEHLQLVHEEDIEDGEKTLDLIYRNEDGDYYPVLLGYIFKDDVYTIDVAGVQFPDEYKTKGDVWDELVSTLGYTAT